MECIIIGEQVYRVRHKSLDYIKTVILDWNTLTDETVKICHDNYVKAYREKLGIPLDATIDEEATYIHETYGARPYKNSVFVDRLGNALFYEQEELPNFIDWLKERDIEAKVEPNVFIIDEEVDYG